MDNNSTHTSTSEPSGQSESSEKPEGVPTATKDELDVSIKDIESQRTPEKFVDSNAGDGTNVFEQYVTGVRLYLCFMACFISMFLIGLDQTIVVTLLQTIGSNFDAYDDIGWVSSGYMLTMAVLSQTWGRLSIIFGRKYSMLTAIILFEAGSLMCGVAPTMNVLIGGRVLAGIGGGGIQTLLFVVMSELVPIHKRALLFACFIGLMSAASVAGPLIGGAFTENISWRWAFYINLPCGGAAFLALFLFYNPPKPKFTWKQKLGMVDYVGSLLLSGGLTMGLLAMSMGGTTYPWNSPAIICLFIVGGITLIGFGIWNFKYSKFPIIPSVIIREKYVIIPVISLFFTFFCFFGLTVYLSTYFEIIHGASPMSAGIRFLPLIISMILTSFITGVLIKKTHFVKPFALAGGFIAPIGMGTCTLLSPSSSNAENIGLLILPGLMIGLMMQSSMMSVQVNAPKDPGSMILSTAMVNFSRSLGGAVGGILAQTVFNTSLRKKSTSVFTKNPTIFEGFTKSDIMEMASNPSLMRELLTNEAREKMLDVVMSSIRNVFYMSIGSAIIIFCCSVLYSKKKIPNKSEVMTRAEYEAKQKATENQSTHNNNNQDL